MHVSILYPLSTRKQHNSIALNIVEKRPSSPVIHIFYNHSVKYYVQMCRKITKIVATRCQILKLKCTKFDFVWVPAEGAYSAPQTPSWIYGVSYLMTVLLSFLVKLLNIRGVVSLRHLRHVPPPTQRVLFDVSFHEKLLKIVATLGEIFSLKFIKYRLAAGLCPDPLGELKRSPRPLSWIYGVSYLMSVLLSFVVKLLNIRGIVPLRHLRHVPPDSIV